jgi:hypothetical protein
MSILTFGNKACAQSEATILSGLRSRAKASFVSTDGKEKRYVGQRCTAVPDSSPYWSDVLADYRGLPVQDCAPRKSYTSVVDKVKVSVNARAFVLLPTAEIVAAIVLRACKQNGMSGAQLAGCTDKTMTHILNSNGAQFIVSGLITEPKSEGYGYEESHDPVCLKTADEDVLFSFRDGVTVHLAGQDRTSWRTDLKAGCKALAQPTENDLESFLRANVASVRNYGRIADMHRDKYAACTNDTSVTGDGGDTAWRALVKANFLKAWSTGEDKVLREWVRATFFPTKTCSIE